MSFEQDPNEQANISGADLAIMVDEINLLKQTNAELLDCLKRCLEEMAWIGPKAKKTADDSRATIAKATGSK